MKRYKIFVHRNDSREFDAIEVNDGQLIGHLVKVVTPELSKQKDFKEDVEIYLEDQDEDFDKGKTFHEVGIKHGDHLFVGRCKKVQVNINYAGIIFTINVGPATTIKKLKKLAIHHFGIDQTSGADLLLWVNSEPLDYRQLIGSLTEYPACEVDLVLATKNDINGDISYDLFQEHLDLPEFVSSEIEGRWGVSEENNDSDWPNTVFWISSVDRNRYWFQFDLTDYPNQAPTARIWDKDENCSLAPENRPRISKRSTQVFKVWGKDCCYLPCDRVAYEGHQAWKQQHLFLVWNSQKDTFLKYLNELYYILNP